jgi:hypothetical protein
MFRSRGNTHCVMAGLVPATHALLAAWLKQDVGARHKAGHDAERLCVDPSGISSSRLRQSECFPLYPQQPDSFDGKRRFRAGLIADNAQVINRGA